MKTAFVSLVGAGPGDPELITLKAINALQKADVVLYDALANEQLLKHAPNAIKQFVGKRAGQHSMPQEEINALIIKMAKEYGHVVRLKGGDPFIFGRAQEEIEAVKKAGIAVEIIPGITSALAVPAMQMIPATCRGIAESCWITTGTTEDGTLSKDIALAAKSSATVIILMGMGQLQKIMQVFIDNGKSKTPVAIIENGTIIQEKKLIGIVENIFAKAIAAGISSPAIIVVGDVVTINSYSIQ